MLSPSKQEGVPAAPECWVVSDGTPGMENQCLGLAEAVGLPFAVKRIDVAAPWRALPPVLWPVPMVVLRPGSDTLHPPWPRLLIASGRKCVAASVAVRRRSGGATFTVQIQNPAVSPRHFDLVAAPRHDRLSGPNVVVTRGALHRVTPERLAAAAADFAPALAHLPRPLVAVLTGGSNAAYRLDGAGARRLGDALALLARNTGAGLAVTPSRRTGAANERILRDALAGVPAVVWDGDGANPYFGYLALADAVVVTCDSVSMASESASTGKPVYVVDLPGRGNAKFRAFHRTLREDGITRPFGGALAAWTYEPLADTAAVAAEVRRRLLSPAPSAASP